MTTLTKVPVQRTVSISIDPDGNVSHAWQSTVFSIQQDGVEIARQQGEQVNIEPADIGQAVPQAGLLAQIAALGANLAAVTTAHQEATARNAAALAALSATE